MAQGAIHIFNYLLETGRFSRERICDAFELMGASFLLDAHDMGSCLFFWNKVWKYCLLFPILTHGRRVLSSVLMERRDWSSSLTWECTQFSR